MADVGLSSLVVVLVVLVTVFNQGCQAERCPHSSKVIFPHSCPRSSESRYKTVCCTIKDSQGEDVGSCCDAETCTNGTTGRTYHCPLSGASEDESICCTKKIRGKLVYTCCSIGQLGWKVWLIVGGVALFLLFVVTCFICCCCSCCCIAQRRQASGGYIIVQ